MTKGRLYCYTNIDSVFPIQAKKIVEEASSIAQVRGERQALEWIQVRSGVGVQGDGGGGGGNRGGGGD